ncbi:Tripartite-type tricarboxylate transporter, receptor component TctC [Variovorax sp. YR266]|nr:Tripartite-type tricarboxylate transporter, receptor component TctC [Variovorax sp. YR266]
MRKFLIQLLVITTLILAGGTASAEDWPTKPIKMVLPGSPGGSPDRVTRMIGDRLSKMWGVPVIVENRPGASTRIAAEYVVHSPPDGYTLLSTFGSHTMAKVLYPETKYDPVQSFEPVAHVVDAEVVFVVRSDSPYQTFADLVADAKKSKKPVSYGHFGIGSSFHFFGLMLGRDAGFPVLPVAYRGESLSLTDLLGGQIDSSFISVGTALPYIQTGKVRALGILLPSRSSLLPSVPTFPELGYKQLSGDSGWFGLLAPAHTPKAIVDKFSAAINSILKDPEVIKSLRDQGLAPVTSTPEGFAKILRDDLQKSESMAKEFDVKGL